MAKKFKFKKLSTNAKKVIVLCSMVAILVTTGVLNFVFNDKLNNKPGGGEAPVDNPTAVESFFNSCKSNKQATRAEELSVLESIMISESATDEMKETANAKKLEILKYMESELIIENMIKAKGFSDVVVNMSENNINIIIEPAQPTEQELAHIYSIVVTQTTYKTSQIFVFPLAI